MGDLVENNKNKLEIQCKHCASVILKPQASDFISQPFELPLPQAKSASGESETIDEFWTVADMFTFENIGFSHTVDTVKYLVCADCELGPIGYHDIPTKKSFIALNRVKYV